MTAADEPEFASYEVGAGLGTARPFLRGALADDPAPAIPATCGDGGEDADPPRELPVRDKLARLDAGLPPLPPGDYPDEVLMPPPRRPAAMRVALPAPVEEFVEGEEEQAVADSPAPVVRLDRPDPEPAVEELAEPAPAPELFRPFIEPPAPAREPEPAAAPPAAPARRPIFRRFRN